MTYININVNKKIVEVRLKTRKILIQGSLLFAAMLVLAGIVSACSPKTEPTSLSPQAPSTPKPVTPQQAPAASNIIKVGELLKNPKTYADKDVTVNGVIANICCGTDFVFKDGFDNIQVFITEQAPMPPMSKQNQNAIIMGTVKIKGGYVTLVAKEIKFL